MSYYSTSHPVAYRHYQVEKLFAWINIHKESHQNIPLSILLSSLWSYSWRSEEDIRSEYELALGNKRRIEQVDLSFPIIVSNFNYLVDGVHRLFKAMFENSPTVKVVFLSPTQIESIHPLPPKSPPSDTVKDLPFHDLFIPLPKEALPSSRAEKKNLLEDYFPDFLPSVDENETHLEVCLERPSTPYGSYLFDSHLRDGLDWWGTGTRVRDIPAKYHLFKGGILAIEEQWIPLSWSHTIARLGGIPQEVILLHLDDHRDMMMPRIGTRMDGQLIDYMTGDRVDFQDPTTISSAIISGAIGKGSILTPLIWTIPKVHVRHLCFRPHQGITYQIEKVCTQDDILFPTANRIGLKFEDTDWETLSDRSNYVVSPNIDIWLDQLPDKAPIFLHFDLDYFNNRFDGSSSWKEGTGRSFELDLATQLEQLRKIFESIRKNHLFSRIVDVSIGISPGFYPAEFWKPMVEALTQELRSNGFTINL